MTEGMWGVIATVVGVGVVQLGALIWLLSGIKTTQSDHGRRLDVAEQNIARIDRAVAKVEI